MRATRLLLPSSGEVGLVAEALDNGLGPLVPRIRPIEPAPETEADDDAPPPIVGISRVTDEVEGGSNADSVGPAPSEAVPAPSWV